MSNVGYWPVAKEMYEVSVASRTLLKLYLYFTLHVYLP